MGRPKGVPNKTTALLKEAILLAAEQVGSDGNGTEGLSGYCRYLAEREPRAFAVLLGKVLPMQVAIDGTATVVPVINVTIGERAPVPENRHITGERP
jgi:hypothetical protein